MKRRVAVLVAVGMLTLSGCEFRGVNSLPLPFTTGTGSDSYQVTVRLAEVGNLVPNAEVKVDDVTVGTVTGIDFEDWHAKLTVSLKDSVHLPANATAKVGQKSLLGAEYLELAAPRAASGELHGGDVVPLARTGRYPETEDLLASLSALLNGGGLAQVKTITTELNNALGDREPQVRALLTNLRTFTSQLDRQRQDITTAIDRLDAFGGTVAAQREKLAHAIDALGPGLKALDEDRPALVDAMRQVSQLGDSATPLITSTQRQLVATLRDLQPVVSRLADAGPDLTDSLKLAATVPFPMDDIPQFFRGDYGNLFATIDLRPETQDRLLLTGTPVAGVPANLAQLLNPAGNPQIAPPAPKLPILSDGSESTPAAPRTPPQQQNGGLLGGLLGSLTGGS